MARRSKLTPAVHEAIVKLVGSGAFVEIACEAVGISKVTYYDWLKRGEDPDETDSRYRTFLNATTRARAEFETRMIDVVTAASVKDARHAEWLLERLFPTRYSNMRKVELTGKDGAPFVTQYLALLESANDDASSA
jgi:DNA invertase Pin-like site-specific DNA recombinase